MEDITIYNDKTRTETTILFNKHDDVIGLTVYFESPKQLSDFWNVGTDFQKQPHPSIRRSIPKGPSIPVDAGILSNVDRHRRFSAPKPCGGSGQRPCK